MLGWEIQSHVHADSHKAQVLSVIFFETFIWRLYWTFFSNYVKNKVIFISHRLTIVKLFFCRLKKQAYAKNSHIILTLNYLSF